MNYANRIAATVASYFQASYLPGLVRLLERNQYHIGRYLKDYWTTQIFDDRIGRPTPSARNKALVLIIISGALLECLAGVVLMIVAIVRGIDGGVSIGLALILAYPLIWAHLLAVVWLARQIVRAADDPKQAGRSLVCKILEWQVVRLRRRHKFTVIAVAGSIGKTSTKLAIAHSLEPTRRVIYQTGNYNDRVTVPLVLFGQKLPGLLNAPAWLRIFVANERTIRQPRFYDMAVLEIGTDTPGDIAEFAYLKPDIAVVTAITPEHMEYFGSLDAVASEELAVCDYAAQVLVNSDDAPAKYLEGRQVSTYAMHRPADYQAVDVSGHGLLPSTAKLRLEDGVVISATIAILGEPGVKITLAAAAVAQLAGLSRAEINQGMDEIKPFAGRMQILAGIKDSTLIDDTYNASPAAVIAGLDVLYAADTPQRIAILGNMNELGDFSVEAHRQVGEYCRPDKLDLIVTVGRDAKKYLAWAAGKRGCKVITATSPYEAGDVVKQHMIAGAVVLAEGSQNGVFAEEALKALLARKADSKKLVRQSADWLAIKRKQFPDAPPTIS